MGSTLRFRVHVNVFIGGYLCGLCGEILFFNFFYPGGEFSLMDPDADGVGRFHQRGPIDDLPRRKKAGDAVSSLQYGQRAQRFQFSRTPRRLLAKRIQPVV